MTNPPVQQESQGWRPEPGDVVDGKLVSLTRGWSDWLQGHYPILTIHDKDQKRDIDVHCFHQVLHERLLELRPKIGDMLRVEYRGQVKSQDGKRTISIYNITAPDDDGSNVWDMLSSEPQKAARVARPAVQQRSQETLEDAPGDDIPF